MQKRDFSWKYQIDLAPIFLRCGALRGPIRRVIQLIGNLRRPEAAFMTIEDVALDRLAQTCGAAVVVRLPSRRKDERATERDVRRRLRRRTLQRDYIRLGIGCARHSLGFAVN